MTARAGTRVGGHVVVDALASLGARSVFGVPGIHALPIWEGLRTSDLETYGFRTELNAGFAACGWAHVTAQPTPLVVSTGPGALNSLTAVMEASSAHLPVVVISSQIPSDLVGRGRGYLHELRDQAASFAPVVKKIYCARTAEDMPPMIAAAFRIAGEPPSGPTYVEIPFDVLRGATSIDVRPTVAPSPARSADAAALREAARLLSSLPDPVIWAGGGVIRSGAWGELVRLAELLDAPVATTYMGKGAIPDDHPLAAGSSCDDRAYQDLLEKAGVVLSVGTELGAETTAQYTLRCGGRLIQIDADAAKIGATYPAFPLVGDANATLRELIPLVTARQARGHSRAQQVRRQTRRVGNLEQQLLDTIRAALPGDAVAAWDMTILGYWAAPHWPVGEPRRFLYPLGSGTLGFAWPAALGAKAALPGTPCLAVVGDGGFMYGMSELLTARQYGLAAKLLVIDDGGYGILREYQRESFGETHAVDLVQPDFAAVARSCGVDVRSTSAAGLGADLAWAFEVDGPAALVLRERLSGPQPA